MVLSGIVRCQLVISIWHLFIRYLQTCTWHSSARLPELMRSYGVELWGLLDLPSCSRISRNRCVVRDFYGVLATWMASHVPVSFSERTEHSGSCDTCSHM